MNLSKLPLNKPIKLPDQPVKYRTTSGRYLYIFPELPNWITISSNELEVFESIVCSSESLANLLSKFHRKKEILINLLRKLFERGILQYEMCSEIIIDESITLHAYLTQECQLRCKHCYNQSGEKNKNEMSGKEWGVIFEEYFSTGGRRIQISGGEPLLFKDLNLVLSFLEKHKKNGVEVIFLTNGLLMTPDIAATLNRSTSTIKISIDGSVMETHDFVRGQGTFSKARNAISTLSNYEGRIVIQMSLWPGNFEKDIEHLGEFIIEKRSLHSNVEVFVNIASFRGRNAKYLPRHKLEDYEIQIRNKLNIDDIRLVRNRKITHCGYGNRLAINSDGEVRPCALGGEIIGNVKKLSIDKLIENCKKIINRNHVMRIDDCSDCALKYVCGGPCKVAAQEVVSDNDGVLCSHKYIQSLVDRLDLVDSIEVKSG